VWRQATRSHFICAFLTARFGRLSPTTSSRRCPGYRAFGARATSSHCLFFKDCFSGDKGLPLLKEALEEVKAVVRFVRDRQKPLALFGEVSKKALILPGTVVIYTHFVRSHSRLLSGGTRFATAVLTIDRFVSCIVGRAQLQQIERAASLISYNKHKQPAPLSMYAHMWLLPLYLPLPLYIPTTPGTALSVFYCSPLCLLFCLKRVCWDGQFCLV
jgi:hypothetical protein